MRLPDGNPDVITTDHFPWEIQAKYGFQFNPNSMLYGGFRLASLNTKRSLTTDDRRGEQVFDNKLLQIPVGLVQSFGRSKFKPQISIEAFYQSLLNDRLTVNTYLMEELQRETKARFVSKSTLFFRPSVGFTYEDKYKFQVSYYQSDFLSSSLNTYKVNSIIIGFEYFIF